ncbi:MAG: PAS domain S-box protein [Candidatus Korarchaeota archaeon]|nr:PAS domain S-box protein [Candidatus Korarchaeota archaeon]NIU85280.1 PAS domain S-box protein [Candidatus Thorarchaeota archaeon]NIW15377.1 PAS domain S-box protein [Candidatus Thorarchaeota archaeon]NIW53324.1 PAS domain S-box protein [Candidatus Korarchaeota archaeon]
MKKSLKESERLSEILMENITEIIAIQDTKHKILKVNRAAGAVVGKKPGELVGKACYEIWADRDEPCDECPVEKAIASGTPQKGEMTTPEGKVWLIRADPIKNEEETVKGAVEIALNITERKRAEEKLKKTEERFKKLFDANPDAAFLVDRKEVFREVNEAACELSGYNREELIGPSIRDAPPFPKHTQEILVEQFQRRLQGADLSPYTIEIQRKNGEIRYVEVNTKPLEVDGRFIGIIGVARDITERKQLEEKLVTLHTWAQKLNRATTMEKIFEYTLDAMGKTLGFTRAAIQLKQETTLNVKAHRGYASLPEQILKLPLDGPGIT